MHHDDDAEADATLDVVLSFLDECEREEAEQAQQHQEAGDSLVQRKKRRPPKRAPGYKPNRARDERRFELIHLRETVCSLEKELEGLRTQERSGRQQLAIEPGSKSDIVPSLENALSMWHGIASRQLEERQRAEQENVRLKDFLQQQIQVATALQKLIHKRRTWEAILKGSRRSHTLTKTTTSESSNAAKFQDLIDGAERALANVDAVMQATGLNDKQPPFSDARVRSDESSGGMVIEIVSTKQLPFDLQATGRAVWRHFAHAMETLPSRVYYPQVYTRCPWLALY